MPQLTWDMWFRSPGCRKWMTRTTFGKWHYGQIFWDAMRQLFYDEKGNPGVLYQGEVYKAAKKVVKWNKNKTSGFDDADLKKFLKDGEFRYKAQRPGVFGGTLTVEGPSKSDLKNNYYASAGTGELIEFNFYEHVAVAKELAWKRDDEGRSKLVWLTAATMLHEMMHNHGFSHPDDVSYDAGSAYATTLPFVAEMAVCRASPYWDEFKGYYDSGSWLSARRTRQCGA